MARLGPVDFEDRLTLVEHLDELRTRIIISLAALAVAFGLCFWQNHLLLDIANALAARWPRADHLRRLRAVHDHDHDLGLRRPGAHPPVILYQAYAFVLPALTQREKRVVRPFLLMVPVLFIAGVVFAYFVVFPAAVNFLLNFNTDEFNIQVRARDYYSFFAITLAAVGVLFQVPIGVLAVTRLGIVTPDQLAKNRRYAILVIAVVAMLPARHRPGDDADLDGAADRAVRGQRDHGADLWPAGGALSRGRAERHRAPAERARLRPPCAR